MPPPIFSVSKWFGTERATIRGKPLDVLFRSFSASAERNRHDA